MGEGDEGEASSPEEWLALANAHMADAQALRAAHRASGAVQSAGIAIECALKGAIMRRERLNRWPDRNSRRDLYTHNLGKLLRVACLEDEMGTLLAQADEVAVSWMAIRDWTPEGRYRPKPVPPRVAADTVKAAQVILQWIIRR